jgi:hypothetical protein
VNKRIKLNRNIQWGSNDKKRLVIDMTFKDHQALKLVALKRNMTITKYVIEAIIMRMSQEQLYEADRH